MKIEHSSGLVHQEAQTFSKMVLLHNVCLIRKLDILVASVKTTL